MKKIVSFFLSFLIFLSITMLIFILSMNFLFCESTIYELSHNIDYLDLVDIKAEEGELKHNYDELYLALEQDLSNDLVIKIYESTLPSKITAMLVLNESDYVFQSFSTKLVDESSIYNLISNEIQKMGFSEENRKRVVSVIQKNSSSIISLERVIREKISNYSKGFLLFIRYLLGYTFKVILVCLLTIAIILQFIINKRNYLPYIFVPTILSSVLSLLTSLFLLSFLKGKIHEFLFLFIRSFLSSYSNFLLFISLLVLFISILSLMMNEKITCYDKKILKPRIKLRHK